MRLFQKIKNWKTVRGWHIWKLKLVDARLYFVSMIVGLLTGLIAVPYHYLLYYLLHIRSDFFASRPAWYWHIPLFLSFWGILILVSRMVGRMPLIGGGGIPQTRGAINGRITYKHPFIELVSKFTGGILSVSAGLSLGREGPSVQIGSYIGSLVSRWTHILQGERKQLLAAFIDEEIWDEIYIEYSEALLHKGVKHPVVPAGYGKQVLSKDKNTIIHYEK